MALVVLPVAVLSLTASFTLAGMASRLGSIWFGASVAFFLAVWDNPPAHVENWATGAAGERRTARTLRRLRRIGWRVSHDLELPGTGNVDHLVIGPGGVYVIDTKAWGGVVRVDPTGVSVTPHDDPDATWTRRGQERRLHQAGAAVGRALAAATGLAVPAPRLVMVLWAPFPQRVAEHRGVSYVAGEYLADWLISHPRSLRGDQVAELGAEAGHFLFAGHAGDTRATSGVVIAR